MKLTFSLIAEIEYDDGDGEPSHDDYSYNTQHNSSSEKRKYDEANDDEANDETDEAKDGESSTSSESVPKKKRRKEFLNLNATFMAGVQGVHLVTDQVR